MSALGVYGDPGGWQHAGETIAGVVAQLADEINHADTVGGSGLRYSWSGPVAEAYLEQWHHRYRRYGDLLYHAGRAANALVDFAGRLLDLQRRAYDLEVNYRSLGLHLAGDGLRFMLPLGHENLAHEVKAALTTALHKSECDIAAIWVDAREAVADVVTILESVIDELAGFQAIGVGIVGAGVSWAFGEAKGLGHDFARDFVADPLAEGAHVLKDVSVVAEARAEHVLKVAQILDKEWSASLDGDVRRAGSSLLRDARTDSAVAEDFTGYADVGEHAMTLAAVGMTATGTYFDARKHGWTTALEDNAGGWASIAAGAGASAAIEGVLGIGAVAAVAAASPVLVTVGAVVVGGVVAAGVGALVQHEVDHHRAAVGHALHDIGGGIRDIGHGIGNLL